MRDKICPACGTLNSDHAKFCGDCGSSLAPKIKLCAACAAINDSAARYCIDCGVSFALVAPSMGSDTAVALGASPPEPIMAPVGVAEAIKPPSPPSDLGLFPPKPKPAGASSKIKGSARRDLSDKKLAAIAIWILCLIAIVIALIKGGATQEAVTACRAAAGAAAHCSNGPL